MNIITRQQWGAAHDDGFGPAPLPAREVWLHHSATVAPDLAPPFDDDYAAVRTLERIGEQRFGGGISYTFVITPVGLIFEGHGVGRQGSHTLGRNMIGRGICWVGNYETQRPTPAQLDATAWLLAEGHRRGWWQRPALAGGHRDVVQTACPGRHAYAVIGEINRRAAGTTPHARASEDHNMLFVLPATPAPADLSTDPSTWPRSREISRPLLPPAPGNWRGRGAISSVTCGWAIDAAGHAQQQGRPSGYIEYLRVFYHTAGGPGGYRDLKAVDLLKGTSLNGNWSLPQLELPDWATSLVVRYSAPAELGLGIEYEH